MKSKVKFSGYVIILTILATVALVAGAYIYYCNGQYTGAVLMLIFLIVLVVFGLTYGPIMIQIEQNYIKVLSVFRTWKISVKEIDSVTLFQPTMGATRICASGGFMGFWGLYREGDVGNYVAFYGRASDCFMIRLKNGDNYLLGCENPQMIVDYLNKIITYCDEI